MPADSPHHSYRSCAINATRNCSHSCDVVGFVLFLARSLRYQLTRAGELLERSQVGLLLPKEVLGPRSDHWWFVFRLHGQSCVVKHIDQRWHFVRNPQAVCHAAHGIAIVVLYSKTILLLDSMTRAKMDQCFRSLLLFDQLAFFFLKLDLSHVFICVPLGSPQACLGRIVPSWHSIFFMRVRQVRESEAWRRLLSKIQSIPRLMFARRKMIYGRSRRPWPLKLSFALNVLISSHSSLRILTLLVEMDALSNAHSLTASGCLDACRQMSLPVATHRTASTSRSWMGK